jgi:hypothetical protein
MPAGQGRLRVMADLAAIYRLAGTREPRADTPESRRARAGTQGRLAARADTRGSRAGLAVRTGAGRPTASARTATRARPAATPVPVTPVPPAVIPTVAAEHGHRDRKCPLASRAGLDTPASRPQVLAAGPVSARRRARQSLRRGNQAAIVRSLPAQIRDQAGLRSAGMARTGFPHLADTRPRAAGIRATQPMIHVAGTRPLSSLDSSPARAGQNRRAGSPPVEATSRPRARPRRTRGTARARIPNPVSPQEAGSSRLPRVRLGSQTRLRCPVAPST